MLFLTKSAFHSINRSVSKGVHSKAESSALVWTPFLLFQVETELYILFDGWQEEIV